MTTKDILNQMEKEFDEKFVVECPTGINKGRAVLNPIFPEPVMSFFHSYTRTLLESFGEEVCPEWIDNPYGEVTNYSVGRRDERKAIRLKVKEILEVIK